MELLTNSRLKSYRACPRQHHYLYTLGVRPVREAPALAFGTTVHTALEAYWNTRASRTSVDPTEVALDAVRACDAAERLDPFQRARATAMVAAYCASWDTEPVEVLAVEREFSFPLLNPGAAASTGSRTFAMAGKLDLLVRLPDNRTAIVEHKTTSEDPSAGSSYRARLAMDGQVSVYFDGAHALGLPADLVLYDVLVKPALKPLEATPPEKRRLTKDGALYTGQRDRDETPDEYQARCASAIAAAPDRYLARIEVVRLEGERRDHAFDVWQLARQIRDGERIGAAPRNPDACFRYGSTPCAFFDVCSGAASLDDPTRFRRADRPHEELTSAA